MAAIEWYYARGTKQHGPVSSVQLKQLAQRGDLDREDLVWREGMAEWIAASKVKGLFEGEVAAAPNSGEPPLESAPQTSAPPVFAKRRAAMAFSRQGPPAHLFDLILELVRSHFTARFVESTSRIFTTCGHYGLYVAMLVLLGLGLALGVKTNDLNTVLLAVVGVLALAVLQYTAGRFAGAPERLNRTTSGELESTAFPDCFALLSMILGVVALLGLTILAVQTERFMLILPGIVTFILCQYLAIVALNPQTLSLKIASDAKAGEEAIGIFSLFGKLGLRLVPVAFGAGVLWGTLRLLVACWLLFSQPEAAVARVAALEATGLLVVFAALPLVYYVFFLFYHLLIDVVRGILSMPEKLHRLAQRQGEDEP